MSKPFRVVKKDGTEPTPEEAKYLRTLENIINHPENAEPIIEEATRKAMKYHMHLLIWGHEYQEQGDGLDLCGWCNKS